MNDFQFLNYFEYILLDLLAFFIYHLILYINSYLLKCFSIRVTTCLPDYEVQSTNSIFIWIRPHKNVQKHTEVCTWISSIPKCTWKPRSRLFSGGWQRVKIILSKFFYLLHYNCISMINVLHHRVGFRAYSCYRCQTVWHSPSSSFLITIFLLWTLPVIFFSFMEALPEHKSFPQQTFSVNNFILNIRHCQCQFVNRKCILFAATKRAVLVSFVCVCMCGFLWFCF